MKRLLILVTSGILAGMFFSAVSGVRAVAPEIVATPSGDVIEYTLPYPGILPDNPLYVLKQVRDWIMEKLIADPLKKAEFYILQGDKRLQMGMMLIQNGNAALGEQSISKGEKYMNNAMQQLLTLKSQGKDVPAHITDKITRALAKHEEIIQAELSRAADAQKEGLTSSLTLVTELKGELSKLK